MSTNGEHKRHGLNDDESKAVGVLIDTDLKKNHRLRSSARTARQIGARTGDKSAKSSDNPRQQLAAKCGLEKGTIDKALAGHFSHATIVTIMDVMGRDYVGEVQKRRGFPLHIGGYDKAIAEPYFGSYQFLRPAFRRAETGKLFGYRLTFGWDERYRCLDFAEQARTDGHDNNGYVRIDASINVLSLISAGDDMRLIMLAKRSPHTTDVLFGTISTLNVRLGNHFRPVVAPVALRRLADGAAVINGEIDHNHPDYETSVALLREATDRGFVRAISDPAG